jgi:hypothetical protein
VRREGQGRVGKGWGEGAREGGEEGQGGQGERARGGWRERAQAQGRLGKEDGRGLQSCLRRAKVWSIITSHACLCTVQNLVYMSALHQEKPPALARDNFVRLRENYC